MFKKKRSNIVGSYASRCNPCGYYNNNGVNNNRYNLQYGITCF